MPEALKKLIEKWIAEKKYGYLQINFQAGGITNVVKGESVKVGGKEAT